MFRHAGNSELGLKFAAGFSAILGAKKQAEFTDFRQFLPETTVLFGCFRPSDPFS
jgi:hypothetical protein